MSDMEYKYYEDQKTERKMLCSKGVDPVWYHSTMRAQRLRERQEEYRRERDQQFQYKTLDNVTDILVEAGEVPSSMSSSDEEQEDRVQSDKRLLRLTHMIRYNRRVKRVRLQPIPRERRESSSMLLLRQTQMIRYCKSFSI
jgi:hypothetical protein